MRRGHGGHWKHRRDRLRHHLHHHRWAGHHRSGPPALLAAAALVGVAVLTPLIFLIVQAFQLGWSTLQPLLFRSLTGELLWHTVSLTVVVTLLCAALGTLLAWFIERTDLPGRSAWAVLVVIPLGIPDFVVSFGWRAIFPSFGGFWAAVFVMTLAVYPLVFLPVAANIRNADPAQEEVARSLGLGRLATFWKVTVGQARLAILGGSVLVALVCLAEFGAFEILGFRTLTTEAYTEFTVGLNTAAGCAFSLILVSLGAILLFGEGAARGKGRAARVGSGAARIVRPRRLGLAQGAGGGRGGGGRGARARRPGGSDRVAHHHGRQFDRALHLDLGGRPHDVRVRGGGRDRGHHRRPAHRAPLGPLSRPPRPDARGRLDARPGGAGHRRRPRARRT